MGLPKALELVSFIDLKEIRLVIEKEKTNEGFLNVAYFNTSLERVTAGRLIASRQGSLLCSIFDSWHREAAHNEDRINEIARYKSEMKPEYLKILEENEEAIKAEVLSWWNV